MKKSIKIQRTAHYYIQEGINAKEALFIIHGYGQLAEEFISEFEYLKDEAIIVIAPEAISKFYNKERKAVANWMTSHEREDEMIDYVHYLNDLLEAIKKEYSIDRFSILAFSQGTSTALRWMKGSRQSFSNAYICSGAVPPELEPGDLEQHNHCQFHYYYGDDDHFIDDEKAEKLLDFLHSLVKKLSVVPFKGKHIVSKEAKGEILEQLKRSSEESSS